MQRKIKFLFLLSLSFILACNSIDSLSETDVQVLSKDQMIQVLTDIHIAEAKVNDLALSGDTVAVTQAKYFQFVCDKHQITPKQLEKSYQHYTKKPVLLDSIYQQVIVNLSELESAHKNDFMHSQTEQPDRLIENIVK